MFKKLALVAILSSTMAYSFSTADILAGNVVNSATKAALAIKGVTGDELKMLEAALSRAKNDLTTLDVAVLAQRLEMRDQALASELRRIASSNKDETVATVNAILKAHALVNPSGLIQQCTSCSASGLDKAGIKLITAAATVATKGSALASERAKLNGLKQAQISERMVSLAKELNVGDATKIGANVLREGEELSMVQALLVAKYGSADQQKLAQAIFKAHSVNGKVNLFDAKNTSRVILLLNENLGPEELKHYKDLFNHVANVRKDGEESVTAMMRVLQLRVDGEKNIQKRAELQTMLDGMNAKGCFKKTI